MAAPTLNQLRLGLEGRLATITGLRAYEYIPDNPNPPCAVVQVGRISYDLSFQRGVDQYEFRILLICGRVAERSAQAAMDAFLNPIGTSSIKTAVQGDATLGGLAVDTRLTEMRGLGTVTFNEVTYMTAEFIVDVFTTN